MHKHASLSLSEPARKQAVASLRAYAAENFDDERKQWLLYHLVVLEYNGETWYDVHPFARRTRAFRDAGVPQAPA